MTKEELEAEHKRKLEAKYRSPWTPLQILLKHSLELCIKFEAIAKDDDLFHLILETSLELPITDEIQLANRFNCSRTTIDKWKYGRNAPFFTIRPMICKYLLEELEKGPLPRKFNFEVWSIEVPA